MEKRGGEVGRHDESYQRARQAPQSGAARNSGRVQIHRRTDQRGQDLHWGRRERGTVDPPPRSGEGWRAGWPYVLRNGGAPRQNAWATIAGAFCQSWFLLSTTRELPLDAGGKRQVHWKVTVRTARILRPEGGRGGSQGWTETCVRRWIMDLLQDLR